VIWLSWRRHRFMLFALGALLVALAGWMAVVSHLLHVTITDHGTNCGPCAHSFRSIGNQASIIMLLLFALPGIAGISLGAPLVARELEQRPQRLVWTQGTSRTRWLLVKWSVIGTTMLGALAVFQLVAHWWGVGVMSLFPIGVSSFTGSSPVEPEIFGVTGVVPVAYALFAFSLGAALGAVLRRMAWAIVTMIPIYAVTTWFVANYLRPHLAPLQFHAVSSSGTAVYGYTVVQQQVWDVSLGYRLLPGFHHLVPAQSFNSLMNACYASVPHPTFTRCMARHGARVGEFYQPGSHYWALQWAEAGIYVAASLALLGVALIAVRRWRA